MKKYAKGGMSADVEADLQALKTLKQPDYSTGGPQRRYARGKVKRYEDEGGEHNPSAQRVGKMMSGRGYKSGGMPDLTGDGKVTRADVLKGRGVFRKGGAVKSSASRRADGCAVRGKTKGKMV